ncbi:MAG: ParM/StbA family protein [Aquificae bacterium]|nr:ParM/StbA family protein [Aquificota bacterium]
MKIAFDLGFGWTKVCSEKGECFKFPSWLAYHSNTAISEVDKVVVDGKEYVVGEDVKLERQKITIASIQELLNYFPVFKKYALEKLGVKEDEVEIITGLPPIYKDKAEILEKQGAVVLPQGLGIFLDVADKMSGEELMIIDIGYNTVDYIVAIKGKRKKGNTIEKLGVERMVELFRNKLPDDLGILKQFSFQRLMDVFEKGYATVAGEKIDLTPFKEKAIEEYNEVLKTRLKDEIGDLIEEIEEIVVAGGGAYYLKNIRKMGVYIPEKPEFSQARGYLKYE